MALSIIVGQTDKKVNSTDNTITNTVNLSCVFKEPCSMHDPVVQVQGLSKTVLYNYAKFLNKYYWVDDIVWITNNIQEVHMRLDPLATFKTNIQNTYAFVRYGDAANKSNFLDDERCGPDMKLQRDAQTAPAQGVSIGFDSGAAWTYVVVIQDMISGIKTYAMDYTTFSDMIQGLYNQLVVDVGDPSSVSWANMLDAVNDLLSTIMNFIIKTFAGGGEALSNILSVKAIPIPLSTYAAQASAVQVTDIIVGPYSVPVSSGSAVYKINARAHIDGNHVISLQRTLASTVKTWLNGPKYRSVKLFHPCGLQEINCNALRDQAYVYLWYTTALCSGEYTIRVTAESTKDSDTIAVVTGTCSIDMTGFVPNQGASLVSLVANTATMGLMSEKGALSKLTGGSSYPEHASVSCPEGWTNLYNTTAQKEVFVDIEYYVPSIMQVNGATDYNAFCDEYGYPVGKYLQLSSVSGYCECANPTIEGYIPPLDKEFIIDKLTNGIYLE